MEIEFVSRPVIIGNDHIVAWELQFGVREGRFILDANGSVSYSHQADRKSWRAGASIEQFQASAEAWNTYVAEVKRMPAKAQLDAVAKLRASLEQIGVLPDQTSYWSVLLEQAAHGLL